MSKRTRGGAPPPQANPISEAHFRLLREYGRHDLPKRISEDERKRLWEMMCQSAGLPHVNRESVIVAWKEYIGGQSRFSSVAINGDIDPKYTTLGITYSGRLTAAHTLKTSSLLRRVMEIFARSHHTRDEFLDAAENLCKSIAAKVFSEDGNR